MRFLGNGRFDPKAIRVAIIVSLAAIQALVIDQRYIWARPQAGGPPATLSELLNLPAFPVLIGILCFLNNDRRVWSWLFIGYSVGCAYWINVRLWSDDGEYLTRLFYQETMLRIAFLSLAVGAVAGITALLQRSHERRKLERWKIALSAMLVPAWITALVVWI